MQECMKDYPELYDKESEGGASMSNTDIDNKEQVKDVEKESNETLIDNKPEASGNSNTDIDNKEQVKDVEPESNETLIDNKPEASSNSTHSNSSTTNENLNEYSSVPSPSISTTSAISVNTTNPNSQAVNAQES